MQNLSKWYCRHLFLSRRSIGSVINNEIKAGTKLSDEMFKLWRAPNTHKYFHHPLSYNVNNIFLLIFLSINCVIIKRIII